MSDIICRSAIEQGFFVSHIPNYGLEQRGGVSLAFIQISDSEIAYPKFSKPDALLVMSEQARERTKQYQIADCRLQIAEYKELLEKNNIPAQSYNIFFLGLIAKMLEEKKIATSEGILKLLEEKLGGKANWSENKRAFELTKSI
jgi:Pyruvate/2-oxoacid:ferredoxin oxidoreductase gamma subunit